MRRILRGLFVGHGGEVGIYVPFCEGFGFGLRKGD